MLLDLCKLFIARVFLWAVAVTAETQIEAVVRWHHTFYSFICIGTAESPVPAFEYDCLAHDVIWQAACVQGSYGRVVEIAPPPVFRHERAAHAGKCFCSSLRSRTRGYRRYCGQLSRYR